MTSLVPYPNSSDTSDEEQERVGTEHRKFQLPSPINLLGVRKNIEVSSDHQNRIRTFPEVRGNWATFVFAPVNDNIFDELAELCVTEIAPLVNLNLKDEIQLHKCEDFHITLSKTVVLQYHLIDAFVKSLENALTSELSFVAIVGQVKIYLNENKTRTFFSIEVESAKILDILNKVDAVMNDFNLELFYDKPTFHISIAWCVGNQLKVLKPYLENLESIIQPVIARNCLNGITVKELRCKIGHKVFKFKLAV